MRAWLVVALLAACGGDDGAADGDLDDDLIDEPDAAVVEDPSRCYLTTTVPAYLGSAVDDCGGVMQSEGGESTPAAYEAARQCVIEHVAAEMPFKVRWLEAGIDSGTNYVLAGKVGASGFEISYFEHANNKGCMDASYRILCEGLQDLGNCGAVERTLCFSCVNGMQADRCEFPDDGCD